MLYNLGGHDSMNQMPVSWTSQREYLVSRTIIIILYNPSRKMSSVLIKKTSEYL